MKSTSRNSNLSFSAKKSSRNRKISGLFLVFSPLLEIQKKPLTQTVTPIALYAVRERFLTQNRRLLRFCNRRRYMLVMGSDILRNCLLRGLIQRCPVPHGERCNCPVPGTLPRMACQFSSALSDPSVDSVLL